MIVYNRVSRLKSLMINHHFILNGEMQVDTLGNENMWSMSKYLCALLSMVQPFPPVVS